MLYRQWIARALALCATLFGAGCGKTPETASADPATSHPSLANVAVSNSWLECCLREFQGKDAQFVRVCPPGTCPGHFDIRPGTVAELQQCRLMFLFDFQQSMDEKLQSIAKDGMKTIAVHAPEGLCLPTSYLEGCGAVHDALCEALPTDRVDYDQALKAVEERMVQMENEIHEQMQRGQLIGAKVIASGHQAVFCRWLGLDVVAAYSGPETASPAQIEALLKQGKATNVCFVIANLQESAQAGEALAQQLNAPVVVFSNFPSMKEGEQTFETLVRANAAKLIKAAREE